jgi:hypothetical protein
MTIDGEKICKPVHHQLSAILNRADKAKAEREKQEQQNPPKKPA